MRRILSISRNTFRENVRRPVYVTLLIIAVVAVFGSQFFNFFNLQKETGIIKEAGIATILVVGLLIAIFTTSGGISAEIEGRVTAAILAKPVRRGEYIAGKFLGVSASLALAVLITLAVLLFTVFTYVRWVGPVYNPNPVAAYAYPLGFTIVEIVKAGALVYFGLLTMAAIGVLISVKYPLVVNAAVCFSVFIAGNLVDYASAYSNVKAAGAGGKCFIFSLKLLIPNAQYFNISSVIDSGVAVSAGYIGMTAAYCAAYSGAVLLVAAVLFERKEIM